MKAVSYLVLVISGLFSGTGLSAQDLEIEGSIKIAQNPEVYPAAGMIRWTGKDFEGFNGIFWVSFTTGMTIDTIHDYEGQVYGSLEIANQDWMIENLSSTVLNNGTSILKIEDFTIWSAYAAPAYCWYDNDSTTNAPEYGALYNWYAVNSGQLCPSGWHVPSLAEWQELIDSFAGNLSAGLFLKEADTLHWEAGNTGGNESGFTARGGGKRAVSQSFRDLKGEAWFWATDEFSANTANAIKMTSGGNSVSTLFTSKFEGLSVRCIRDP